MTEKIEPGRPTSVSPAPDLWAAAAIAIAVGIGMSETAPLVVPPEIDHYRDMGATEALLDGQWGRDPAFLGETAWYPPLLPLVMALLAKVSGLPLTSLYVHVGPLLNGAAPVTFYLLVRHLFGGWTAVLSLVGFLFAVNSATPTWTLASYSPWLWPVLFAQTFFYLTLKAWFQATEGGSWVRSGAAGALLGATFLAHPAPAVLLVGTFVAVSVVEGLLNPMRRRHVLARLLTVGVVSALVCAPFLLPLIARYGLHTENSVPSRFGGVWLSDIVHSHLSLRTLGALGALGWLWQALRVSPRSHLRQWTLALVWTGSGTGLVYGIAAQKLEMRGIVVPLLFPTFHFHFYLLAAEALVFGPGLLWLGQQVQKRFPQLSSATTYQRRWLPAAVVTLLVVAELPTYFAREDFTHWPEESRKFADDITTRSVYEWSQRTLRPTDVVLASTKLGMFGVVAAGHCVVSTYPSMANPYVDLDPRETARATMFEQLRRGDYTAFAPLAAKYGVTYVIAENTDETCCALQPFRSPLFQERLRTPRATVYEFVDPGTRFANAAR